MNKRKEREMHVKNKENLIDEESKDSLEIEAFYKAEFSIGMRSQ